jgi:Phosphomevalonate kinase.
MDTKPITILTLSGDRESGKDTIADLLVDNWGFKKLELAGLAKEIVCRKLGLKIEQLKDRKTKELYRPEIIAVAEKLKELDLLFHCHTVTSEMWELRELGFTRFVVADARFPYEALYFRGLCKNFKSLYIQSDLGKPHPEVYVESYIHSYFEKKNGGVIINNRKERYDRNNQDLINQLVKFVN